MTVNTTGTAVGTALKLAAGAALVFGGSVAGTSAASANTASANTDAGSGSAVEQVPSEVDSIPSGPGADAGAQPVGYTKVWKHTWKSAPSYRYDESGNHFRQTGGTLFAGSNYVYCQARIQDESESKYKNDWWLLTDDDSKNANVWVSAVYFTEGANWEKIPGVKKC